MDNKNHNNIVVIFVFTCCGGRYRPGSYRLCIPLQFSLVHREMFDVVWTIPSSRWEVRRLVSTPFHNYELGSVLSFPLARSRTSPNLTNALLTITRETAQKSSLSRYYSSTPLLLNDTLFYQICNSQLINIYINPNSLNTFSNCAITRLVSRSVN